MKLILTAVFVTVFSLANGINAQDHVLNNQYSVTGTNVKLVSFTGSFNNNKVVLQWIAGDNDLADIFEVEKSTDGRNFAMAALVFGTDKKDTDNYQFYEKAGAGKMIYRIKIITKSKQVIYSESLSIH